MINTRLGISSDIPGILALQAKNLFANLTEAELEKGFVTTPFTPELIEDVLKFDGVFVAENGAGEIVGYAYAGSWEYFSQWKIMELMASRLPQLAFQCKEISVANSFQYGPVCVAESCRGQGVFPQLFEEMRLAWKSQAEICFTFINQVNKVSERAHLKIGWEIIDRFEYNDNQYFGLAFDMNQSVL
ncbi:MAG: N-acetyltransferase family protein [Saprospiraceae bacterium]